MVNSLRYPQLLLFSFIFVLANYSSIAQTAIPDTKVYFFTDQSYYFSGEEINLGILLVDPVNFQIKTQKELVYISLKDRENQQVFLKKLFADKGKGSLSIKLPDSIPSGYYELHAYTNWMRNFNSSLIYRKKIAIYNVNDEFELKTDNEEKAIEFYPEGGKLLAGNPSRVAFKVSTEYAETAAYLIETLENDTISHIEIPGSGFGSFYFKPKNDVNYHFVLAVDSAVSVIPEIETGVLSLSVINKLNVLQILVRSDNISKNDSLSVAIECFGANWYEVKGMMNQGYFIAEVPKSKLPEGRVDIHLKNSEGEIVNTRPFIVGNFSRPHFRISGLFRQLHTREEVNVVIETDTNAILNFRVLPIQEFDKNNNIINAQAQGSLGDLDPKFYNNFRDQDNAVLTSKIDARLEKLTLKQLSVRERYLFLKGVVTDDKPLPDSTKLIFFVPGVNSIHEAVTDKSGYFEIPLLYEFTGSKPIHFYAYSGGHQFDSPSITNVDEIDVKFNLRQEMYWDSVLIEQKNELLTRRKIEKAYSFYTLKNREPEKEEGFNIDLLVPEPDLEIDLKEFVSFGSMAVITKELLPGVFLRKKQTDLKMFSEDLLKVYDKTPFIFIDNIPTNNVAQYLSLNPKNVLKIKVINRYSKLQKLGPFGEGGIIIIDTKQGQSQQIKGHENAFIAQGLFSNSAQVDKGLPTNSNYPDMRRNLCWKTGRTSGSGRFQIQFRTSDRPGKYVAVAEIITSDGKTGVFHQEFEVTPSVPINKK